MPTTPPPKSSSAVVLNTEYGTELDYQNAVKELAEALPGLTSTEPTVLEEHGKSFGDQKAGKLLKLVPTLA
jgi:hypothetical protein